MKVKEELDKRRPRIPNDDILLPNTLHELQDVWVKIITTKVMFFLTWAHPTLNTTSSNNGLILQLRLASISEPDYNPHT